MKTESFSSRKCLSAHTFQVKQIIAQFEYIAQESTSNTGPTSAEEMVWSAMQQSVMGLIKENAVNSFYEEVSILN